MSVEDYLLVAAIDLGTTYSGYAYSFRDSPKDIHSNSAWTAGSQKLISLKTPTCLLLNPDKKFDSFGYEAENKFGELAEDDEHREWFLFRHFKMLLYKNEDLSNDTVILDINNKPMPAHTVFALSLKYFRNHLLEDIVAHRGELLETEIKYVIIVPSIWSDLAKYFMREAAIEAGFISKRLHFSLEPEAASIWCRTIEVDGSKASLSGLETKYVVVNLGGGTADITVHEVDRDDTLKELHKSSGGPWGGTVVDNNFLQWLADLFGIKTMERFKSEQMSDYFELLRDFDLIKRNIDVDKKSKVTFKLALSLMTIYGEENELSLNEKISTLHLSEQVRTIDGKLRIDRSVICELFESPVNALVSHLQEILQEKSLQNVSTILLAGEFGESKLVQRKLKTQFKTKRVITPYEAGLAVLKGAVIFGHNSEIISARVMKYVYGFKVHVAFNAKYHDKKKAFLFNGEDRVYVFRAINELNETTHVGQSHIIKNMQPNKLDRTIVQLYASDKPDVKYIDDAGCTELGTLLVEHPEGKKVSDKKFDLIFIFGKTELIVKARIQKTGREYILPLNCLNGSGSDSDDSSFEI